MYKRVLVPLDGSTLAEEILPLAGRVSNDFNIPLHLLTVIEQDSVAATRAADSDASEKAAQKAQDYLSVVSERISGSIGPEHVKTAVKIANVADAIVQEAESVPETLIALSSHGRSGLTRMVLGSVADKVLRGTKVPVFLYSPREDVPVRQAEDLKTIIVPLDGSELAEQALPHAAALAEALKLRVVLVRVTSTLADLAADGFYEATQVLIDELEKEAIGYLDQKVSTLRQQGLTEVDRRHLTGSAANKIIDSARETPRSFIAMCTHGRSGVRRWALGSVTDQVVSHVAVPVLVIRAAQKDDKPEIDKYRICHDWFLGFMKINMLHHVAHGELYGLALIKELGRRDHPVPSGTMYPVLHEVGRVGYLSCMASIAGGKVRQQYSITDNGQPELAEAKKRIGELVEEVVEGEGPASMPNVDVEGTHSEGNHNEL